MIRKPAEPWTIKEMERLEYLRFKGLTIAELALELYRTRSSIQYMIVKTKTIRPLKVFRYLPVLLNGKLQIEQAKELGLSIHAVKRARLHLRRLGLLQLPDQRIQRHETAQRSADSLPG